MARSIEPDLVVMGDRELKVFEIVLAIMLTATPLILWLANETVLLESISAYYGIDQNQWFYFPLTAAAILFLVNGIFHDQHFYNIILGAFLAMVVLFNHQDADLLHKIGTWGFFLGNAAVIAFFSRGRIPKAALLVVLGIAGIALWREWVSVFWAETISMVAISAHFVFDTIERVDYHALRSGINLGPLSSPPDN